MMINYKIVRIAGLVYKNPIKEFSENTTNLHSLSYKELQASLFRRFYTYGDSFSRAMRSLGHEAEEIVYDLKPMQVAWAREFGVSFRPSFWQWDILLAQIEKMRPDIVFFQDIHSLPYSLRSDLKNRFPFLKLIVIFRGYPETSEVLFKELSTADLVLVGSPILQNECSAAGLKPHLVYHYFDEEILTHLANMQNVYDFTFIGSSGFKYGVNHQPRYEALFQLLKKSQLRAWIDEEGGEKFLSPKERIKSYSRKFAKDTLKYFPKPFLSLLSKVKTPVKNVVCELLKDEPSAPLSVQFPSQCMPSVFGLEMYQILAQSKISFNKHSAAARNTSDNIRLFQATGVGSCLLTDFGTNIHELFEVDREIVTYRSIDECIEKVAFLLSHEKQREEIMKKGQQKTLKEHTALRRCQQMDELFQNGLRGIL